MCVMGLTLDYIFTRTLAVIFNICFKRQGNCSKFFGTIMRVNCHLYDKEKTKIKE